MGRISDDLLLNPKTNTNGANNLTEWRNFDGTRHSEKLNQITLADMEGEMNSRLLEMFMFH